MAHDRRPSNRAYPLLIGQSGLIVRARSVTIIRDTPTDCAFRRIALDHVGAGRFHHSLSLQFSEAFADIITSGLDQFHSPIDGSCLSTSEFEVSLVYGLIASMLLNVSANSVQLITALLVKSACQRRARKHDQNPPLDG